MVQNGRGTVIVDASSVANTEFSHSFRGYDAHEVKAYLQAVSGEMQRLEQAVADAEHRLAAVEAAPAPAAPAAVGDEAARVLQAAEDAAAEIRARAEEAVAKMLRDAQDEVTANRSRSEQERADVLAAAEREAQEARDTAATTLDEARVEGRTMVEEARQIRERVLSNLSEKRQVARRELTQLRAGIEELRSAYGNIEALLAASVGEIDRAIPSARAAALRAGEQAPVESGAYVAPETAASLAEEDIDETPEVEQAELAPDTAEVDTADDVAAEDVTQAETDAADVSVPDDGPTGEAGPASDDTSDGDSSEKTSARDVAPEPEETHDLPDWVAAGSDGEETGTVIDIQSRRTVETRTTTGDSDEGDEQDSDELDPELPAGDSIDERRQAERRQLFEEAAADRGETVVEFTPVMDEFGPEDTPVPLVPHREQGDIDQLFARIRESRAGAVAQAREVLQRTSEIPIIDPDAPPPEEPTAGPDDLLVHRDEVLHELVPEVTLALKRALADQLNEVLDALRRTADGVVDVEQLVPTTGDRVFGEAIRELLSAAGARGAGEGSVDSSPVVRAVASQVGDSLRERITGFLGEPDQLERRIRSVYREWRRDRVDTVAGDAVASAYSLGLLSSLAEGTPVRWVIPQDGCCGADCYDNSLATDVTAGDAFPTGDVMAPARPGCRGLVVPANQ